MLINRWPVNGTGINAPGPLILINVSGTITPSATFQKQANTTYEGTITPSATLQKQVNTTYEGTITPSATLQKQANITVEGTITPSGVVVSLRRLGGVLWTTLLADLRRMIDDVGGEIHTDATLYRWMEHGELFLVLNRYLLEDTRTLTLSASTPIYTIHSAMTDFILPLRMNISGSPLLRSNLSAISQLDDDWFTTTGTPERYSMIGTTLIDFHPVPTASTSVTLTFLRVPPSRDATTNIKPFIPDEWHRTILEYAAGVALAIEGNLQRATEHMERFVELAGLARDWRFMASSSVKPAEQIVEKPLVEPED